MNTKQLRADFEAWWETRQPVTSIKEDAFAAYQAGRAALQSQTDAGWKEAFKAWNVCASIHREWAKGKDAVFTTRQADFVWNAENAFKKACGAAALQSQDREDAEWMTCESRLPWVTNSLKQRANALREAEKRSRRAFNKDYMGEPARYFADACAEAAAVFEARLSAIDHARRVEGERE